MVTVPTIDQNLKDLDILIPDVTDPVDADIKALLSEFNLFSSSKLNGVKSELRMLKMESHRSVQ